MWSVVYEFCIFVPSFSISIPLSSTPSFHLLSVSSSLQLRQQVEGWAERVSELEAEMSRCEVAHNGMLQDVANKDERIMVLIIVYCCWLLYNWPQTSYNRRISRTIKEKDCKLYYRSPLKLKDTFMLSEMSLIPNICIHPVLDRSTAEDESMGFRPGGRGRWGSGREGDVQWDTRERRGEWKRR